MKSKIFTLDKKDLLKGVIVAIITAFLTSLLSVLQSGGLPTLADLKVIGVTSLTAAVAYLVKNFVTDENDMIGKR